ncbi:MAG: hypothetical protein OXH58_12665 [Acidimicrobiaceae bacterium]|nr:hypothetical protein [Acidimicrobiaceae bacterium]
MKYAVLDNGTLVGLYNTLDEARDIFRMLPLRTASIQRCDLIPSDD